MEMWKIGCLFTLLGVTYALETGVSRCSDSCLKLHPSGLGAGGEDIQLVKHCAKLTPEGRCECDWEKRLTPDGACECLLPGHVVDADYKCVCRRDICPTVDLPAGCTLQEPEPGECCPKAVCTCPEDSYMQDGRCVCYPCKIKTCNENMIIHKGNQTPGSCCDLYQCNDPAPDPVNKTCRVSNIDHQNGDTWVQDCVVYNCINGIVFHNLLDNCEQKSCVSGDQIYENSSTWMEDECTNCTCINGEKKCVAHFCKDFPSATIRPTEECPSMEDCTKKCSFGYKVNRRGCELCKCKQLDVKIMQEVMRKLNCTAEHCDVLHKVTSMCRETKQEETIKHCPCPEPVSSSHMLRNIFMLLTAILSLLTGILLFLLRRERRRSCSLSTQDGAVDKYLHIPMFDANLNQDNKPMLISAKEKPEKDYR